MAAVRKKNETALIDLLGDDLLSWVRKEEIQRQVVWNGAQLHENVKSESCHADPTTCSSVALELWWWFTLNMGDESECAVQNQVVLVEGSKAVFLKMVAGLLLFQSGWSNQLNQLDQANDQFDHEWVALAS